MLNLIWTFRSLGYETSSIWLWLVCFWRLWWSVRWWRLWPLGGLSNSLRVEHKCMPLQRWGCTVQGELSDISHHILCFQMSNGIAFSCLSFYLVSDNFNTSVKDLKCVEILEICGKTFARLDCIFFFIQPIFIELWVFVYLPPL